MTYELSPKQQALKFSLQTESPTAFMTAPAMLMYPHLVEPETNKLNNKVSYTADLIFRKDQAAANDAWPIMYAAINAAMQKWVKTFDINAPNALQTYNLKTPWKDGATRLRKDKATGQVLPGDYYPGYGPDVFSIKIAMPAFNKDGTARRPKLLGPDGKLIEDKATIKEMFYGGAIVRALLNAYSYGFDPKNPIPNKGINFGLEAIQLVGRGQARYDGGIDVESAMGELDVEDFETPAPMAVTGFPAPAVATGSAPAVTGFPAPATAPTAATGFPAPAAAQPGATLFPTSGGPF